MEIAILGATGSIGRALVEQATARGHDVVAVARHAGDAELVESGRQVRRVSSDVHDAAAVPDAISGCEVVIGALGVSSGDEPGVLAAGARAAVAAHPERIVWLGAYGCGASADRAGALTRAVLRLAMKGEIPDKVAADEAVLAGGGTILHSGPFKGGPLSDARRTVALDEAPKRLFPARIARATVAACLLDIAEDRGAPTGVLVPLES